MQKGGYFCLVSPTNLDISFLRTSTSAVRPSFSMLTISRFDGLGEVVFGSLKILGKLIVLGFTNVFTMKTRYIYRQPPLGQMEKVGC